MRLHGGGARFPSPESNLARAEPPLESTGSGYRSPCNGTLLPNSIGEIDERWRWKARSGPGHGGAWIRAGEASVRARHADAGGEGFYGSMGLGGSIFQWHPGHEIGFGYVPTSLHVLDFLNERGKTYQAEVLGCVEKLNK